MRRILGGFVLIILATLLFTVPAFANGRNVRVILPANETINRDYFAQGSDIEIHGTVNGDVYAVGGNVLIDGTINGDILAVGGNIIISGKAHNVRAIGGSINLSQAKIDGNASIAGGNANLAQSSDITGSVVGAAGTFTLVSPIGKDVNIAAGSIDLADSVKGDVNAAAREVIVSPGAKIDGNLTYWSNNKANISSPSAVIGKVKQIIPPSYQPQKQAAAAFIAGLSITVLFVDFIASFAIGLFLIYLMPFYTDMITTLVHKKTLQSLGIGFLTVIVTPVIIFALLVSIFGIPLGIILLFTFLLFLYFAKIYIAYAIGAKLLQNTHKIAKAWILLLGLVVYAVVSWIPLIGPLFQAFAILIGVGALVISERDYFVLLRNKKLI